MASNYKTTQAIKDLANFQGESLEQIIDFFAEIELAYIIILATIAAGSIIALYFRFANKALTRGYEL